MVNVSRKDFLKASAAFAAAVGLDPSTFAETSEGTAFKAASRAAAT